MRLSKTQMIGGAAAATLLIAVPLLMRPKPIEVDASAVTIGPLDATVDADGKTRVRDRYVVVAPVAGRVERIVLVEGSVVRAGQVVATLRPLPLDSSTVAQVRARIEAADALVVQAAAQSRMASADLDQRRRELWRAQRLAEVGGGRAARSWKNRSSRNRRPRKRIARQTSGRGQRRPTRSRRERCWRDRPTVQERP